MEQALSENKLPDTPMNRRLVKSWERQRSLRNSTQQKLFTSPPQRDGFLSPLPSNQPAAGIFLDMQSTHVYPPTSRHAEHSCCNTLLDRSTPIEPIYTIHQSTEEEPERPLLAAEAINLITVDQMLSGTSVMSFTSSPDVFAGTMSLASVPQEVSEHMKNRANSVAGFLSRVKVLNPDIALPTARKGYLLRIQIKSFLAALNSEYRLFAFPTFTAQVVLQLLHEADELTLLSLFHRAVAALDDDLEAFEFACAHGIQIPQNFSHSTSFTSLAGYHRFDEPAEFIRVQTDLLNLMSFSTSSELQDLFKLKKDAYNQLRFASFKTVEQFSNTEAADHALLSEISLAAQRSIEDPLDRGLRLLANLPFNIRSDLDRLSRKKNIQEISMHRDWVFQQLLRMQNEKHPSFSWMLKDVPPCNKFAQGKCSRDDCRFAHIATPPTQNQHANLPAAVTVDEVTVTCQSAIAPDCAGTFAESKSFWSAKTDSMGKPYNVPKSCKPCRDLRRLNSHNHAISQLNLLKPLAAGNAAWPAVDANLTLAIEDFGLDPDDDAAMADYNSRYFE